MLDKLTSIINKNILFILFLFLIIDKDYQNYEIFPVNSIKKQNDLDI